MGFETPFPETAQGSHALRAAARTRKNLFQETSKDLEEEDGQEEDENLITIANMIAHDGNAGRNDVDIENRSVASFHSNGEEKISWQKDISINDNDAKYGRDDIVDIVGGNTAARTMEQAAEAAHHALQISEFIAAWHFTGKGKEKCHSVAAIAVYLETNRPLIVAAILEVTTTTGAIARDKIMTAHNLLKNDSRNHRMVCEAVMTYFWAHHKKSALREQFRSIIQDYALAADQTEIDLLLKACSQGHTSNLTCPDNMIDVDLLPGVTRLTLTANMDRNEFDRVVKSWRELFQCMANFVCEEDISKPRVSHLDKLLRDFDITRGGYASPEEITKHVFCKPFQSIQAVTSQMHQAYLLIDAHARREGQPLRVPTADARKKNLILVIGAAHERVYRRMCTLIDNNRIDVDTMSFESFLAFVFTANEQLSARSAIMSYALTMLKIPLAPKTAKDKDKDKDKDMDKDKDKQTPNPPVFMLQGHYVFQLLIGKGVTATDQDRAAIVAQGKCGNCFGWYNRKYPHHTTDQCPFTPPNGLPRAGPHHPVSQLDGKLSVASDASTIAAALHDRRLLLANRNPSGGNGKGHGKGSGPPSVPKEHRTITFQPMRITPTIAEGIEKLDDTDSVAVPDEVPQAPIRLQSNAWSTSARNLWTCGIRHYERASPNITFPPMRIQAQSTDTIADINVADVIAIPDEIHPAPLQLHPHTGSGVDSRQLWTCGISQCERRCRCNPGSHVPLVHTEQLSSPETQHEHGGRYIQPESGRSSCPQLESSATTTSLSHDEHFDDDSDDDMPDLCATGAITWVPSPYANGPPFDRRTLFPLDLRHLNKTFYRRARTNGLSAFCKPHVSDTEEDDPPSKFRRMYAISSALEDSDDDDPRFWDPHPLAAPTQVVHDAQRETYHTVEMFLVEICGKQAKITAGSDTYAELTVIRASIVKTLTVCPAIQPSAIRLQGVGGHSMSIGFINLEITLQHGWQPVMLPVHILTDTAMPQGVDILFGVDAQQLLGMESDRQNHFLYCHALRGEIPLDTLDAINRRRNCPKLSILASCSGGSFIYCTLTNLGYRISKWYAIETDSERHLHRFG